MARGLSGRYGSHALTDQDDPKTAVGTLREEVDRCQQRWREAAAHLQQVIAQRSGRIDAAERRYLEVTTGRRLAKLSLDSGKAELYEGALVIRRDRYPLRADINAEVVHTGGTTATQGWVVKSQFDDRAVRLKVQCADWYVDELVAKGVSVSTGNTAQTVDWYVQKTRDLAHRFAADLSNAARDLTRFEQVNAAAAYQAADEALNTWWDLTAIRQALDALQAVARDDHPRMRAAVDQLDTLKLGRVSAANVRRRSAQATARNLLAAYAAPIVVDPGPKPDVPGMGTGQAGLPPVPMHWPGVAPDEPAATPADPSPGVPDVSSLPSDDPCAADQPAAPASPTANPVAAAEQRPAAGAHETHVRHLLALRDAGILTDAEFAAKIAQIADD